MIGFFHTDDTAYLSLLTAFEPDIDRFVAVSADCESVLRRAIPWRDSDICLRPYGIDFPARLERTYSRPDQPIRLFYAGRLVEQQKRVSDLVRLAQRLGALHVDFELQVLGEGKDRQRLRDSVSELPPDLRRRVILRGAVPHDEMAQVQLASDVCVLVSAYEGTSIVMLESMANACVPVTTRVSGTAALLRDGESGFTVPVGDMERMAQVITDLARNRDLLVAVGSGARAAVESHSMLRYVEWFERLIDDAWNKPRSRPMPGRRTAARLHAQIVSKVSARRGR